MDTLIAQERMHRLARRRDEITRALDRLGADDDDSERDAEWLDQAGRESRLALHDRLKAGYTTELERIDKALERIALDQYGVCVACHQPIDSGRLQATPEAEFCTACQAMREELQNI